jgi:signal transduction histidine kinase
VSRARACRSVARGLLVMTEDDAVRLQVGRRWDRPMVTPGLAFTSALRKHAFHGMRGAVLTAAGVSAAATAVIVLLPQVGPGYERSAVRLALETAASLIALLAAFLIVGRLQRHPLLNELMLASGLTVLAVSNLLFGTLPILETPSPSKLAVWASLISAVLGALLFALAAFVPRYPLPKPILVLAGATVAIAAALTLITVLVRVLAVGLPRQLPAGQQAPSGLHMLAMLPALQITMAVLYALAAVGFVGRSEQHGDEFMGWLAIAAVLAAAARVDYFLYPVASSGRAYTGEAFRLFFYGVLLIGSMREIWSYWRELSDAAVLEERRRVARDLHDGLAQELAYLARNLDLLDEEGSGETIGRLRRAVERAQTESRRAVRALTASNGQAFEVALMDAASEIAERFNIELVLDTIRDVRLSETRAEALVRIACEAVTNAGRHSGASRVHLSLKRDGQRVRLRVSDTGCGFDTNAPSGGFGLVSMHERASSVGADLRISTALGRGSQVEVVL